MEADRSIKLIKAAKELNIGTGTMVDFLQSKGYKIDRSPMARLTDEMYLALKKEFSFTFQEYQRNQEAIKDFSDEHLALELIMKSLKNKTTTLDLGRCNLTEENFQENTELHKNLRKCTHIQHLILSNEWWIYNVEVSEFSKRISANGGHNNRFKRIPKTIVFLTDLISLICCGDHDRFWSIADLSHLANLKKLRYLDLRNNQIENITPLKQITHLTTLFLTRNVIKNLTPIYKKKHLKHLDASQNKVNSINGISGMSLLEILDLSENEIQELDDLIRLENLKEIYIHNNHLQTIDNLDKLISREKFIYIEIHDNPIINDYQLKLIENENHLPFIVELFQRLKDKSLKTEIIYPVKILLFGNHASGKSSLVNFLNGKIESGSTHILRIVKIFFDSISKSIPDAIFYDFGGQDFYHGVYRAFVSSGALQIILYNRKNDKNELTTDSSGIPIINYNRRYWLGQKKYQEANYQEIAPYIMVQTFAELNDELTDLDYINYPGLEKSFVLSFADKKDTKIEEWEYLEFARLSFKSYLFQVLKKLQIKSSEPLWYIEFLKYVFGESDSTHQPVSFERLVEKYNPHHLDKEEIYTSLKTNLITLHRHGVVLYYPTVTKLANFVWLSPQKLVAYIQTNVLSKIIIESSSQTIQGIMPKATFEKLVKDEKILELLKIQKVVFLHSPTENSANDEYIIPNYLPLVNKEDMNLQLLTFGIDNPDFTLKFNDFLPFGFINQMICFYGKQPDVKKFWRNQLLFTVNTYSRVLIEIDFKSLLIKVHIECKKNEILKKEEVVEYMFYSILALYWDFEVSDIFIFSQFLDYKKGLNLIDEKIIHKIHKWESLRTSLQYLPEDLYISIDSKNFVSYLELVSLETDDFTVTSYQLLNNNIDIYKTKVLPARLFEKFTYKKVAIMKKIFVSYSKFDEDYLQDFEDHLITLKSEGVATFNCRKIEFGKEWDEVIKKEIDDCDIMVCLISVKFLNTDYITRIELTKAIEQNKMIIPIIIKACDWENSAIGKYQAAQRGKIVSLNNQERLHGVIKSQSREERDAFWTDIIKEFRTKIFENN